MLQDLRHYLNAIKAKQSALNARNPRSAVGNPTSALGPSGSSFDPSSLAPTRIQHLLLSNLTTDKRLIGAGVTTYFVYIDWLQTL